MRLESCGLGLCAELSRADAYVRDDFAAIERCIDRIEGGICDPSEICAHQYAMMALNCHGGIICGSIEMMKYEFPDTNAEPLLGSIRNGLSRGKRIALRIMTLLGITNAQQKLRHYSCKFRELFTPNWLKLRNYSSRQRERILNEAIRCARAFLRFLADMLVRLEEQFVVDDMRPIAIGTHATPFVLTCHRMEGVVLMRLSDQRLKLLEISPRAKLAWRVIRMLVSADGDGVVTLPANALSLFRNTDSENTLKKNGLSEFAQYVHSAGRPGAYCLMPHPKRRNEH